MTKIIKNIVKNPKSIYGFNNKKQYITIHETDNTNKGADAVAHGNLQQNGFSSSWHYTVDDKQIVQSFAHNAQCWHAGDGRGNGNLNSIGIEICVNSDGDYKKAVENAAWLTKKIMEEENIALKNVVQHNNWSGKNCPRNLRSGAKGVTWKDFIEMVSGKPGASTSKPTQKPVQKPAQNKIWRNYISGNEVKQLQRELNKQFNKGLAVDGYFGQNTINALVNVRKGARGNLTRIIQQRLQARKYDIGRYGADGIFGNATEKAVRRFQNNNKLVVDGIVGKNTWKALFRK